MGQGAQSIKQFLSEKNITILESPNSLDFAPYDFFFKHKRITDGTNFETCRSLKEFTDEAEGHLKRILSAVHRSMAQKDGKMH